MNLLLQKMMKRLHTPADGEGNDLPGGGDYGDDFTATEESPSASAPADEDQGQEGQEGEEAAGDDLRAAADEVLDGKEDKKDTGTPKTGKGKFIPLDRHEKLLKKERARREEVEAQLAQSRAGREMAKVNDSLDQIESELVEMEARYNDMLAEGDTKGAAQMMTSIRRKNAELNSLTAAQRDAEVMARAVEKVRYDEALDRIEEAYPQLDSTSDEFDEDLLQDVSDMMQAGIRRGLSATKALQRAVSRIMGAETSGQKRATTTTPRVDESEVANDLAAERRGEAVKRNLDASKRTPPATHRTAAGNDAAGGALTAKAVMQMSEADFEKLDEKDLARLRGDTL